jgi:flagella basal body P-ring formation protein FlgA
MKRKRNNKGQRRGWVMFAAAMVGAAALAQSSLGDDIVLRGSVRMQAGAETVTLGDIAELTGPAAERLAGTVVGSIPGGAEALEITVGDVRQRLDDAGAHWGRIQLSGGRVIVRPAVPAAATPPLAMTPIAIDPPATSREVEVPTTVRELAADLVDRPTLRGTLARMFVESLGVDPNRLRLAFNDHRTGLLETDASAARFEIRPLGLLASDRVEFKVRQWADGHIEQQSSITVLPMLNVDVALPKRDITRGEQIRAEDLTVEPRWLLPSQANAMTGLVQAVGRIADDRLKAGEPVLERHVKHEQVIKRGDRVMVRCLVGGVVISLEAEARSEGAAGETVELRKLGERDTFMATATGPGAAVLDLSR